MIEAIASCTTGSEQSPCRVKTNCQCDHRHIPTAVTKAANNNNNSNSNSNSNSNLNDNDHNDNNDNNHNNHNNNDDYDDYNDDGDKNYIKILNTAHAHTT